MAAPVGIFGKFPFFEQTQTLMPCDSGPNQGKVMRIQTVIRTEGKVEEASASGVRVLVLTDAPKGPTVRRLAGFGTQVEIEEAYEVALYAILDDPLGYDLLVIDCDGYGGIEAGERAIAFLIAAGAKMRIMLISREFEVPAFPLGRRTAVCLPTAVPDAAFRRGFDHVLRDRVAVTLN
jgi:hypothetical protein